VHPNYDVNMVQIAMTSSRLTIHVSAALAVQSDLLPALRRFATCCWRRKEVGRS